jgi:ethanolamine ammonia-lyase small subunit
LAREEWRIAPLIVALEARVALGDDIGERLGARQVAMLIGERPGLSAPDSLGIYLTYNPKPGRTEAERNCISNVRPEGLPYTHAARTLHFLMREARARKLTGVPLKENDSLFVNYLR